MNDTETMNVEKVSSAVSLTPQGSKIPANRSTAAAGRVDQPSLKD
jgi:hypothetical protein